MSTPSKSGKKIFAQKREKKPIEDARFKQIESDPRFRRFHADKSKLKVDSRFKSMFTDKNFQVSSGKYDPRGKRVNNNQREQYEKFYELEDEENQEEKQENEENEEEIQARTEAQEEKPRRRGPHFNQAIYEGFSSSSDEDESDLSDDQAEIEDSEFNDDNNDDNEVEMGEATKRIAVMNCDWWKLKAVDLFVVFSSFLPTSGSIKSVTIYPSDYGEQELAKETETGPKVFDDIDQEGERTEDGKFIDPEKEAMRLTKIRQYEVNRFKYFYAVVEFDSVKTAALMYEQCDGLELERTSNVLDLRYIPDDVTFTKKPKEVATSAPYDYKAPTFFTAALQSSNVEITWDQTDYNRLQLTTKKFNKDEMREDDFRAYLASDSEESEDDLPQLEDEDENKEQIRNKYQSLIEAITPKFQEEEEMEITFTPGFSEKAESLLDEKKERDLAKDETVWETQQRKMKEKKKEKKAARKEEFKRQEEEQKLELEKLKKQRRKKKGKETEEEKKAKAELELLMMDDNGKQHKKGYNLQSLIEDDDDEGKKSKRKRKMEKKQEDEFKVDVQDERFQQLFSNPQDFGIDPTHKNYKKTAGMKQIMKERVSRRQEEQHQQKEETSNNSDISNLIKSVKKKAQMHPVVKKQKF